MKSRKKYLYLLFFMISAFLLTACDSNQPKITESVGGEPEAFETESQAGETDSDEKLQVAFIYTGQPGDLGFTYEHDRGRMKLDETLGEKVETFAIPDTPDGPSAEKALRDVINNGADLIFATSFGYLDAVTVVAGDNPGVFFEHFSGNTRAENISTYLVRMYQARYLTGIVAGSMTENGNIGFVAAFPIPDVLREINAFTLGVRAVNPDAEVHVVWTNTWYDPVKEREAAIALLDAGADIIAQHQDTTEPQKAAKERGKLSIGSNSDMGSFVGETVLTSSMYNLGPYYIDTAQAVLNGTWESHDYWGGLSDNVVKIADFSPRVPEEVKSKVEAERRLIVDGERDVFCGPIYSQQGSLMVNEGECLNDGDMRGMDWFVEGVIGSTDN